MTLSLSDLADGARWVFVLAALVWIAYAWLHRVEYRRVLLGLVALIALDWGLHALGDFADQPNSPLPSDYPVYSLSLLFAALAGLLAACVYARATGLDVLQVIDAALVIAIVGGVGGRAYHVALNWNYYAQETDSITDLSQGGFGIHGAIAVGLLTLWVFARITRASFWRLGDAAAVGLALAQGIGWLGAYITHFHYGVVSDAWYAQDLPDAYNIVTLRVPVQLFASVFYFGLFIGLLALARRFRNEASGGADSLEARRAADGWLLIAYLVLASAATFVLSFWRGEETVMWNSLRVDQWMDLALFGVGIALGLTRRVTRTRRNAQEAHSPA